MSTQSIRDAVQDGDYVRGAELFAEWAQALPASEASLRAVADLAEWVRATVVCAEAHGRARLQALRDEAHAVSSYCR